VSKRTSKANKSSQYTKTQLCTSKSKYKSARKQRKKCTNFNEKAQKATYRRGYTTENTNHRLMFPQPERNGDVNFPTQLNY
jgi:hypothetical protein